MRVLQIVRRKKICILLSLDHDSSSVMKSNMDNPLLEQIATTLSNLENSSKIKELVKEALSIATPSVNI